VQVLGLCLLFLLQTVSIDNRKKENQRQRISETLP